jgi:hypothetical protein
MDVDDYSSDCPAKRVDAGGILPFVRSCQKGFDRPPNTN